MTRTQLLNALIRKFGYTSYLEIGVNTPAQPGYNFPNTEIALKHGVDPAVDTDFKMTSDEFFESHVSRKYDLVFVDGLHLFEQAHRDIVNSLAWLGENGTIVVHDCNPVTEITQRRERASDAWHGDVWKAILKLRMEEPKVEILTVDTDEGCTVIRPGRQELLNYSETPEVLYDYAFFDRHRREILNLVSVKEFVRRFGLDYKAPWVWARLVKGRRG
jgi:hypothetical protein